MSHLTDDHQQIDEILAQILAEAQHFLAGLNERPVGPATPDMAQPPAQLPAKGLGAVATLARFKTRFEPGFSGSAGPRYFGFVTGGVTPAALAGDWLTGLYDQNALGSSESIAPQLELETIAMLRDLFGLSPAHSGAFVTGATMANFVGLALGRQWVGQQAGIDVARQGLAQLPPMTIFSGTPHASSYKALAMLGLGREAVTPVACLPGREAMDVNALANLLAQQQHPGIVIANAGTVNTVDFDNLTAIAALRETYPFWLHVDAAFGGFAACSPRYRHWVAGLNLADSITIDAHKWLNVPYDAAMQFTRHPALQAQVFQNAALYLGDEIGASNFVHRTPENSRRLRALASWFTLTAYGQAGYTEIIERNCALARQLGAKIDASDRFELLAPVRLNGICFTLQSAGKKPGLATIKTYLANLQAGGKLFLTPTMYRDTAAIRVSISNWRTTAADIDIAWTALQHHTEAF